MNGVNLDPQSLPLVTTVGDLVVAVTDAALEVVHDERKAYQVAGLVLNNMLLRLNSGSFLMDERYGKCVLREA